MDPVVGAVLQLNGVGAGAAHWQGTGPQYTEQRAARTSCEYIRNAFSSSFCPFLEKRKGRRDGAFQSKQAVGSCIPTACCFSRYYCLRLFFLNLEKRQICYCITSFYSPSFLYRHKKTTPPVLEGPHSTWIYP